PGAGTTNPALGLRAIRYSLRRPELFITQLRAILRASALGPVRMMLPMLTHPGELDQVMGLLEICRGALDREGLAFDPEMPVGGMMETPAAALGAEAFARRLDFVSIGTNDLIQYTLAIDRSDDEVNYLYDPAHPAVLQLIDRVLRAGQRTHTPVAMCGEMAGDVRYTRLLLGLGLRTFSVRPDTLPEIKCIVRETDIALI
ncbi:MAG: putative PEP-binding protein, partial [Wenzhouxiangella sp.]